jgi:hypothetical protein
VPLEGAVVLISENLSPSGSTSLASKLPVTVVSSGNGPKLSSVASRPTTWLTLISTLAMSVPPWPSLSRYLNVSVPVKPAFGV